MSSTFTSFELSDLRAERRLRHVAKLRGLAEPSAFGDRGRVLELPERERIRDHDRCVLSA